jgi:hypothetical protein
MTDKMIIKAALIYRERGGKLVRKKRRLSGG